MPKAAAAGQDCQQQQEEHVHVDVQSAIAVTATVASAGKQAIDPATQLPIVASAADEDNTLN